MKLTNNEKIDILKLYSESSTKKWNYFLSDCLHRMDMKILENTYRGLQAGMDDLAKKKLNTDKVNELFVRWTMSIEKTMKKIVIKKNPKLYDPTINHIDRIAMKRKMDIDFENYLKKLRW